MLFSLQHFPLLYLLKASIETVTSCKYLRIVIDDNLSIKPHIEHLLRKLEVGPLFLKLCFSFTARKRLVATTFLPVLDYGDTIYTNTSAHSLHLSDSVYHRTLYDL